MNLVTIAIGLGLLSIVYGFITSRQVLGADPGNAKMQEIAAAIQEGAQAYLKRQYTAIGVVGVIVAIIVAVFLGPISASGFVIGAILSGAMLLRFSLKEEGAACAIERAVEETIASGYGTSDIGGRDRCSEFAERVVGAVRE